MTTDPKPVVDGGAAMRDQQATHITVTQGMRGWFAVMVHWQEDGFWEPVTTGDSSHADIYGAIADADVWAEAEGMECRA